MEKLTLQGLLEKSKTEHLMSEELRECVGIIKSISNKEERIKRLSELSNNIQNLSGCERLESLLKESDKMDGLHGEKREEALLLIDSLSHGFVECRLAPACNNSPALPIVELCPLHAKYHLNYPKKEVA